MNDLSNQNYLSRLQSVCFYLVSVFFDAKECPGAIDVGVFYIFTNLAWTWIYILVLKRISF